MHDRRESDKKNNRLLLLNLKQGGMVLRELALTRREIKDHTKDDVDGFAECARRDSELEAEQAKLKTDVTWIRRVGIWAIAALGLGHFFK